MERFINLLGMITHLTNFLAAKDKLKMHFWRTNSRIIIIIIKRQNKIRLLLMHIGKYR